MTVAPPTAHLHNGRVARICRASLYFLIGIYGNPPPDTTAWIATASFAVRVLLITGGFVHAMECVL